MILGIGVFFVGLAVLFVLCILLIAALGGEVEIGLFLAGIVPLLIGIYQLGNIIATHLNWI